MFNIWMYKLKSRLRSRYIHLLSALHPAAAGAGL
jgi:hypothetical protein